MKNRDSKRRTNRIALILYSISGLMALLSLFFPAARAQSLDGFWQSDAYGLLVEIRGANLNTSQTTSISCLPWWTAKRSDGDGKKSEVIFKRGDTPIRLTPGPAPDTLLMRDGISVSSVSLRRISARPDNCSDKLANTPQNNYAVFWQTFAEQFALFPLYGADWAAVDRKYRPQVTASTTPEELFGILREMILPFHNAHTNINAPSINRLYIGYKPVSEIGLKLQAPSSISIKEFLDLSTQLAQRTRDIIESKYSDGKLRSYCNDVIYFGMLRNSIGYLRILGFEGYAKDGGFEQEMISLESALDDIFKDAKQMNGLIIDVRINPGGADPFCLAVASRLTGAKYLAYSKVTRNNLSGPLRFTAPQSVWVDVSTRPGYRGKIVLLIGPESISGGETFAMALMGRKPQVTSVGENTQGVFSDIFARRLPNGWTFGLPNELFLTETGKSFDGAGVAPDIRAPVFPKVDLEGGRDSALEKALEALGKR
jgi:peptidase S41-like protein/tricorn protease-like protein